MSHRLTNENRDAILRVLIKHRFEADKAEIKRREIAFALTIYKDVYSVEIRSKMADFPKGFFSECSNIYAKFGTRHVELYFGERLRVASEHDDRACVKVYPAGTKFADMADDIHRDDEALKATIKTAEVQAEAVLKNVNTLAQLFEVWPDIKTLVDAMNLEPPPRTLPAVVSPKLNDMFKLPAGSAKKSTTRKRQLNPSTTHAA